MRRILFLLLASAFLALVPAGARAEERIRAFDVEAAIRHGDDLTVNERIAYDFSDAEKHGLFRYLPELIVVDARKIDIGLQFLSAFRDGASEPYRLDSRQDMLVASVGDAAKTVQGFHEYRLVYKAARAVVAQRDGTQRLAWNVTGNGWPVAIERSSFRLDAPVAPLRVDCFVGGFGRAATDCDVSASGTTVVATLRRALDQGEGWTVQAVYPPGTFVPGSTESVRRLPWLAPWMVFSAVFSLFWAGVWFFFGRDARGRGTVIPEYDPPAGLKPYEVAALANNGCTHRLLAGSIIDLARRGFVRLKPYDGGASCELERTGVPENGLDAVEADILKLVFLGTDRADFGIRDSRRGPVYEELRSGVDGLLKARGWHQWDVGFVRGAASAAVVVSWLAALVAVYLFYYDPYLWLALVGLAVGLGFAYLMPRRTVQGALLFEQIEGFRRYVLVAEKDRLAFHEAPARTPERFSALLPYAVAIGVEREWGALFRDIALGVERDGGRLGMTGLEAAAFAHSVSQDVRSFAITPSSPGGGGGFSGGGAGGGGGGSW